MASQGPLSPGTLVDDSSYGSVAWSNPSNAGASDNSYATAVFAATGFSHYLKGTNPGFSIPSGATIDGIVVEVERKTSDSDPIDARARIVKGGTIGSTEKATATTIPTSDTYKTFGSSSDLWGETWTTADINASNFGFAYMVRDLGTPATVSVDHIRITVHYTATSVDFTGWGVPI